MPDPDNFVPTQPDEAHFLICQRAAENLGRLVDGNGLKAEQVRLAKHETLVHQVPGYVHIEFKMEKSVRTVKGQSPSGKQVASEQEVNGEASVVARALAADRDVQEQIMAEIRKDEGQGFGMEPFKQALNGATHDFSVVETCLKCQGQRAVPCAHCNAQGMMACPTCNAQGWQQCQQCYGQGFYFRGGQERLPCNRCGSQGRVQCMTCMGQRQTRCTTCQGLGRTACLECAQTGYWTKIFHIVFEAHGSFALDREQIPKDVLDVIDVLGVRETATQGYAQVFRAGLQVKQEQLTLALMAFLPIAKAEFTVEGRAYPATVAGLPGRILIIEPVLDTALKPGINALFKLSKGPMAAQALIDTACRYRIIRQAISGLAHQPKRVVYQKIKKEYPVGISDKYAKAVIKYAEAGILAISRGPRLRGLLLGSAAAVAIIAGYYMGPLREQVLASFKASGRANFMSAADLAVLAVGYLISLFAIKFTAAGALKKLLPDEVQTKDRGLPPAGEQGWYALGVTALIWFALAFVTPAKPDWVQFLLLKMSPHAAAQEQTHP